MRKSLIVAMANNRVIGADNTLPWHLPADLKHFRALTMGHPIIMGRKTYESIGKPLPGRRNIVVTSNKDFSAPGCIVVPSLHAAMHACANTEEIFIIGGSTLFQQALPMVERIYLTQVDGEVKGDIFFPLLDMQAWREVAAELRPADEKNIYPCRFVTLDRISGYKNK
ncbi:MAG: dihydrofolate reductase [Burkholderiales bacterium]